MLSTESQIRINDILASNAAYQARLGEDSTAEEKRDAKEFWHHCLAEIAMIDKDKAEALSGGEKFSLDKYVSSLLGWKTRYQANNCVDKMDQIVNKIVDIFKRSSSSFSVEFIIESLSKLGLDTALVYDNNGHWAMPDTSRHQVVLEPSDLHINYFVGEDLWKNSVREAIEDFLYRQ